MLPIVVFFDICLKHFAAISLTFGTVLANDFEMQDIIWESSTSFPDNVIAFKE